MKLNTLQVVFLVIATLGLTESKQYRQEEASLRNRLGFVSINDIFEAFLPALNRVIQNTLAANLQNVDLRIEFSQDLANLDVTPNCTTSATIDYNLGMFRGIDSFHIDSIELVPGSEEMELTLFGLRGVVWGGEWVVRGSFDGDIEVDAEALLRANGCDVLIHEVSSGRVVVSEPGLELVIAVDGSSPNIFRLPESLAESIIVEDARFDFDSIFPEVGGFLGNSVELDLATIFDGLFSDALLNQLLPLIIELIQNVVDEGLPF